MNMIPDEQVAEVVQEHIDLRPKGIIQILHLLRPVSRKTAACGQIGRDEPELTWEGTGQAPTLRAVSGLSARGGTADVRSIGT